MRSVPVLHVQGQGQRAWVIAEQYLRSGPCNALVIAIGIECVLVAQAQLQPAQGHGRYPGPETVGLDVLIHGEMIGELVAAPVAQQHSGMVLQADDQLRIARKGVVGPAVVPFAQQFSREGKIFIEHAAQPEGLAVGLAHRPALFGAFLQIQTAHSEPVLAVQRQFRAREALNPGHLGQNAVAFLVPQRPAGRERWTGAMHGAFQRVTGQIMGRIDPYQPLPGLALAFAQPQSALVLRQVE